MVYLLYRDLPWLSEEFATVSQYLSLAQLKRSFHVRQLSPSCPGAFQEFLDICREDRWVHHPHRLKGILLNTLLLSSEHIGSSDYANLISLLESLL